MSQFNKEKEIFAITRFALKLAALAGVAFLIAKAIEPVNAAELKNKTIVVGTTVGDFAVLVSEGLKPELEKKGYQVKLVQFTDYVRPNLALSEGSLDVNIFQHKPYLDEFSKEKGLSLSVLVPVPTAPLGLYAGLSKTLAEVKEGSSIAVPNDPTNLARALVILSELGWVELKKSINPLRVSLKDIQSNRKNLKIVQLEAAQLPRSLSDVNYAVINGNYATSAGIAVTSALAGEKNNHYINYVVVRTTELNSAFAKDFAAAANSPSFKSFAKKRYAGYKFPSNWK
jgi:D-methionine transport system substrate-binding protein